MSQLEEMSQYGKNRHTIVSGWKHTNMGHKLLGQNVTDLGWLILQLVEVSLSNPNIGPQNVNFLDEHTVLYNPSSLSKKCHSRQIVGWMLPLNRNICVVGSSMDRSSRHHDTDVFDKTKWLRWIERNGALDSTYDFWLPPRVGDHPYVASKLCSR
jgi:hypothetical protein